MKIEEIRERFANKVDGLEPIGNTLKFNLDGEIMLVDGRGDHNVISGEDIDADCTISMSKETWEKIQRKEIKPMAATLTGQMKVKGDLSVARKLKQLG